MFAEEDYVALRPFPRGPQVGYGPTHTSGPSTHLDYQTALYLELEWLRMEEPFSLPLLALSFAFELDLEGRVV